MTTIILLQAPTPAPVPAAKTEDSDDGVDLFGSDDEEESAEAARIREERLAAYNAKKSKSNYKPNIQFELAKITGTCCLI